jgi:hypothetical protein
MGEITDEASELFGKICRANAKFNGRIFNVDVVVCA